MPQANEYIHDATLMRPLREIVLSIVSLSADELPLRPYVLRIEVGVAA